MATACQGWIKKLIDPSRRNNLLFFRELKLGTLDLSGSPPEALAALLAPACEPVPVEEFVTKEDRTAATAKLQEIRKRALANEEERGLETLYLALGIATWPAADDGKPYSSPILLMPLEVEQRGTERRRIHLRRSGDLQPNLVLVYHLEAQGIDVNPEALVDVVEGDDEGESFNLEPAYELLTSKCQTIDDFRVERRFILSNFSFQKMAIVKDLRERVNELAHHDVVAAIAQDASARETVRGSRNDIDPRDLDRRLPDQEFLVLDSDSTQQRAIIGGLSGQNGVISGPPGTGKSQTIANLIAECAATGRKVLFVAEKRAALEAVFRRLDEKGLSHLCLDLHGADVSRRQVMERVSQALERVREAVKVDPAAVHRRYVERRERLNRHVQCLHTPQPPSSLTVYALQGRLLQLPPEAQCSVRWRDAALNALDFQCAEEVAALLDEAADFEELFLFTHESPWTKACITGMKAAQQLHDLSVDLSQTLRSVLNRAAAVFSASGITGADDFNGLEFRSRLLCDIAEVLTRYRGDVFSSDLHELCRDLTPAAGPWKHLWALMTSAMYRAARRTARNLRYHPTASRMELLTELREAADVWSRWLSVRQPESQPTTSDGAALLRDAVSDLRQRLNQLAASLPTLLPDHMPLTALQDVLDRLVADSVTPFQVVRVREIEHELVVKGVGALIDDIRATTPPGEVWPNRFRYAWLRSCLDAAFVSDPALANFNGLTHQKAVEEFKRLDRERLELAIQRVVRTHAERVIQVRNQFPDQDNIVRKEAAKKRRHLPLRQVFREAPDVLTALHPCWMASPLSVSQLLPGDHQYFDLVVFDEASQVLPEDAVTSLLRGTSAVVAGDRRQLPPTTFFAAGIEEADEEDTATGGFESLLDVMSSILDPPWGLEWHYRSRDESLIGFSNHFVYGDRLVTFPGPGGDPVLKHVHVPHVLGASSEESSSAEVQTVVELVLEHAVSRPNETLGVIAMGIVHARRVEAAVDKAAQERPELDDFFDAKAPERFFVKNLERVQGDERDAIILTIGYGKDAAGRLPHRFGPLLNEGGERRLNVAVTRARRRLTLVSSFTQFDVDPARTSARGVELLRLYLEYAANGGTRLSTRRDTTVPLNDFEQAVYDTLVRRGMKLLPQWGASKYRIDLVAQHPAEPGRFVLAIECDGATYHSAATARERDRLRQQHLEALGWRFHRIWSTDWFLNPEREIARVEEAFRQALAAADRRGTEPGRAISTVATSHSSNRTHVGNGLQGIKRPRVPRRPSIDQYTQRELDQIVSWVSASSLKTDDEIVTEVLRELGFERRGSRIEAAIREAIARVRPAEDDESLSI